MFLPVVLDAPAVSAEGRSSPPRSNNASSPQALCVNAKRCPHGAQAAKRPEGPKAQSSPPPEGRPPVLDEAAR